MTFTLDSTTVVPLTRKLAKHFAEMTPSTGERAFKQGRIEFLRMKLDEGVFHSPRWSFTNLNGSPLRGNGQHSSKMLNALTPEEWKKLVHTDMKVIIDEYTCESEADLPELFNQFDPRGSVRSNLDLCMAHGAIHTELESASPTSLNLCIGGIAAWQSDFYAKGNRGIHRVTTEDKARLIHVHVDFVKWASSLITTDYMKRMGVASAMFATFSVDQYESMQFWGSVVSEDAPKANHPTRILGSWLRDASSRSTNKHGHTLTPRHLCVKCIHAWNAFRNGGQFSSAFRYFKKSKVPNVL